MLPKISFEEVAEWAEGILSQMTLAEKCNYVGGEDIFFTQAIERLGLKRVLMSDATAGVNLRDRFRATVYQNAVDKTTQFPSPIVLASTWNPKLSHEYARSVGEQCNAQGVGILLGPGFNLYRHSQCGRNFEYFGEDPFLISRMVEAYVTGMQSTDVVATLKHFCANNTDYFRRKSNSVVDERTLNEIYFPAFKAGIDAGALAVMTSYNLVNGEWASQSKELIHGWLRQHLGFKWLVMTDWWAIYDCKKTAESGQDLEMPGSEVLIDLEQKVKDGEVAEADVDRMVKSILTTLKAADLFNVEAKPELMSKYPEHEEIALQTAREGTVLLRNENNALPIKGDQEILVIGNFVSQNAHGGGAATVKGYDHVTLLDALKAEFGDRIRYESSPTEDDIKNAKHLILSMGTLDSEGWDRAYEMKPFDHLFTEYVVNLNPNTILLMNSGSGVKMTDYYEKTSAIIYAWYNGQNGQTAVAEILSGKTNPSGKLPITLEKDFKDSPAHGYIPDSETLYGGWNDEWEAARDVYDVEYKEGVFVGYRWYEHKEIEPLYAFGHGLSYTSFEYSNISVSQKTFSEDDTVEVAFTIKNTGELKGAEVAQLYVRDLESSVERPLKELKGFSKVELAPGESKQLTIQLDKAAFSFYDVATHAWKAEPGDFEILVGASSTSIILSEMITLA